MRKQRPRYPRKHDVALMIRSLSRIPMDKPLNMGWRESEKGTPNFRLQTLTNNVDWTVDIYAGHYYIVRVGSRLTEECNSIPSVIIYLYRMLGLKREADENS